MKKTETIKFRVSLKDKEKLKGEALAEDKTVTKFIRDKLGLNAQENLTTDSNLGVETLHDTPILTVGVTPILQESSFEFPYSKEEYLKFSKHSDILNSELMESKNLIILKVLTAFFGEPPTEELYSRCEFIKHGLYGSILTIKIDGVPIGSVKVYFGDKVSITFSPINN